MIEQELPISLFGGGGGSLPCPSSHLSSSSTATFRGYYSYHPAFDSTFYLKYYLCFE